MTGKEKLIRFIEKITPDDMDIRHISMTFCEDGTATICLSQIPDDYTDGTLADWIKGGVHDE